MTALTPRRGVAATVIGRVEALLARFDPGDPHPYRGPFTRWPRVADGALALTVFAASLVTVTASGLDDREAFTLASIGDRPAGAFVLLALAAAALVWRRQRAIAVTAFLLAVMIAWALAGYGDGQEPALLVATYSVGRYTANHRHGLATIIAVILVSIIGTIIDPNQRVDIAPAVVVTGLPWYLGRMARSRADYLALLQDRAEHLEAEQQARARQAVAEERSRIARELHDVVAHRVSMMTVQAGAAKTIARNELDSAIEAMGDVEREGRQALAELRHLLGVLRPDSGGPHTSDPDDLGPQPGLADVPTLVDQLANTGAEVTFNTTDAPQGLPAAVELSAFRIIQESLTNIVKHAGPNPAVDITVAGDGHTLVIDITNTIDNRSPVLPRSGYGIVGMRERASLLGGTLTAAPQPPDHYRVYASLPLEPEPT
ncbi:MAG: histidine kinase [Acidimicrobiia bacterium]|nr:histidine kinase [Acidimicrobiia bacterium]